MTGCYVGMIVPDHQVLNQSLCGINSDISLKMSDDISRSFISRKAIQPGFKFSVSQTDITDIGIYPANVHVREVNALRIVMRRTQVRVDHMVRKIFNADPVCPDLPAERLTQCVLTSCNREQGFYVGCAVRQDQVE